MQCHVVQGLIRPEGKLSELVLSRLRRRDRPR
ncbi:hypothetical protein EMIT0P253_10498 [Pseudomonas sp. IT-P253]